MGTDLQRQASLVVMAAGMGSRFGGLKQIEGVGPAGEALLEYAVFDAWRAGFSRLVFVVRDDFEAAFRARMQPALDGRVDAQYVCQRLADLPEGFDAPPEREKPWGTGHAVWCCRDVLDGPFAVINADDYYGRSAFSLAYEFLVSDKERRAGNHALIGYEPRNTVTPHGAVTRGICEVSADGALLDIRERRNVAEQDGVVGYRDELGGWHSVPEGAVASMNFWGFRPSLLEQLRHRFFSFLEGLAPDDITSEFLLPTVVGDLVNEGGARVRVLPTKEAWLGMTYREDLERVRRELRRRIDDGAYPSPLWGTGR